MNTLRALVAIAGFGFLCLVIARPAHMHSKAVGVLPDNHPPTAVNDSYTLHGIIYAYGMLDNDTDPDNDQLHLANCGSVSHGTLTCNYYYNTFIYYPVSGYAGADSFTYQACDGYNACSTATINLNVVNHPPTAVDDSYTIHDIIYGGGSTGFMINDTDSDGDPIDIVSVTMPAHGTLNYNYYYDSYIYYPNYGFTGTDTFTYQVCDYLGLCSTGTVTMYDVNNPPLPVFDFYIVRANQTLVVPAPSLKLNDFDPDSDAFYVTSYTQPTHGTANYSFQYSTFIYNPSQDFVGEDSFTYTECDYLGGCDTGTVYIFVLPGNGPSKPPYGCECPSDPPGNGGFNPASGGLPGASVSAKASYGPSGPDPVNLATGRETFAPEADMTIYNPTGPAVVWQRSYVSARALAEPSGYGSPGLSRGWVHNYDISIQATSGSWGNLTLIYPNGATETLTPQLSSGVPTGAFTTVAGAPYKVTGVSGSPTGVWQSVTVTWKDETQWKFTQLSGTTYALSQLTNRTGQSLDFTWNSNRALTQVADHGSGTTLLTLTYSNGHLSTATDAYSRKVVYGFSAASSTAESGLQTVSDVVSSSTSNPAARWTFTYASDNGRQLHTATIPSPTGTGTSTATINYDSTGRVSSLVDANGNQRVYTYNSATTGIQIKDPSNNVVLAWTQKFDSSGSNTGVTDAANHSTTIAYGDSSNPLKPTSFTDRNGHETTYSFDQFGNITEVTTPRGLIIAYTWDYNDFSLGRLTSIQEGSKPATTIAYYEPSGLVHTITRPEPNNGGGTTTTTLTYDSLGNVLTVTGPGNNSTSTITTTLNYTTDGSYSQAAKVHQPITVTDSLSHVMHLRYDSQGRLTSLTDALGNETDFNYNIVGQSDTTTYPATGQTGSGHSHNNNAYLYPGGPLTAVTAYDEANTQVRQITRAYGLEGELLSISGSTEPVTNTYDPLYRIKTVIDGNSHTTTYAYNNIGLVSSINMPGSEVTQFTSYDNAGNLLQRIDGNNVTTNYVYDDDESLLTDIEYPATTSLNVHFDYDSYGRRSAMTDGTGSQSYSYGNLDETLSVETTYTGLSAKTISYAYYPDRSRASMTTPAGTFDYSYDGAGRPSSMTNPFSETTSWSYQNNNWLNAQTLANGAVATYTHNALGQVTELLNQIGSTTVADYNGITYDGVGNRTSVTASIPGATSLNGTTGYTYDTKNQLTQETSTRNGGSTDNFAYDSAGNPTSFKGVSKSYNSNNQQTGTGFTHDGNGNPTTYASVAVTFDPENRMTVYGSTMTAGYNGDGLRAWKQNSSTTTYFLYDGILPIVELNSSGSITATNSFGAHGLVSRRASSASLFYNFDIEGNVSQRSDSSGSVLSNHLFGAHGTALNGSSSEPFGYKARYGYYTDNETGMLLLAHRYYDPTGGRFLTRDPINYRGGINLYSYVQNNPVSFTDSSGLILVGAAYGGSAIAGVGVLGAGVTGQYASGFSITPNGVATGGAVSIGGFAALRAPDGSGRDVHIEYPLEGDIKGGTAVGASAGGGPGLFISNADDYGSLRGSFNTTQLNTPLFSLEFDSSGDVWSLTISGPSAGFSYANFWTYTPGCTTWDAPFHPILI